MRIGESSGKFSGNKERKIGKETMRGTFPLLVWSRAVVSWPCRTRKKKIGEKSRKERKTEKKEKENDCGGKKRRAAPF